MSDAAVDKPVKDRRRQEILEVAFREFAEKGYAGTSMEAIAREARASKETLYSWFTNKAELFRTIYAVRVTRVDERIAAAGKEDPRPAHVLPCIAEEVLRLLIDIAPMTQSMGAAGRTMGSQITGERNNLSNYLLWCQAQGYIAFDDDPFELASMFIAMAQGEWGLRVGTGMTERLTDAMIREHAERAARIFLRAFAPEKKD